MKKFLLTLAAVMLMAVLIASAAFASDFDSTAKELSKVGMFKGTGTSFDLDRAPTRGEAAVMLVRLYGAEAAAKADFSAGKISSPFTDCKNYTAPYVAWLYTKGLTKGSSATTFTPGAVCDAKQYCTFVLRALGYGDTDFKYADALTFAQSKGLYSPEIYTGKFLRDDVADVTYQALAADLKDGSNYLLASLISSGAIDKTAASDMTAKIETYRAMMKSMAGAETNSMDADMTMKMNMNGTVNGEAMSNSTVTSGNVKTVISGADIQSASTMTATSSGATTKTGTWLKDGWVYMSVTSDGTTQNLKYKVDNALAMVQQMDGSADMGAQVGELAMIKSITASTTSGSTVYTLVIDGKAAAGMANKMLSEMGITSEMKVTMNLGDITMTTTVSSAGLPTAINMQYSATISITADGVTGSMKCDYDTAMKINAIGSSVKITFPDFTGYTEVDMSSVTG